MKKQKEIRVLSDTFKQKIFEIVMEAGEMIPYGVQNALLDTIRKYGIGPVWRNAEGNGPREKAEYYFIRVRGKQDSTVIATWNSKEKVFQIVGEDRSIFRFCDIEQYSAIQMPE